MMNTTCAICLDEIETQQKKNIFQCINCNNLFHSKCINLIISNECPLCRYVYNTNMNYLFYYNE